MPTIQQLEQALIKADAAGDEAAARQIAAEIRRQRQAQQRPVSRTRAFGAGLVSGFENVSNTITAIAGDIVDKFDVTPAEAVGWAAENLSGYSPAEARRIANNLSGLPGFGDIVRAGAERRQERFDPIREQRPNVFTAGEIGGEIAGTAPLVVLGGGAAARGGQALARGGGQMVARGTTGGRAVQAGGRALQMGGRAVQTGGVGVRAPTRAAVASQAPIAATRTGRMALRVGGGGTAGAAAAVLTDQEVVDAALTGAVIPLVGTVARRGAGATYDLLRGRIGETRAAEVMRNLIASNPSAIATALRNAPENARANTAEFLASQGLLTPELAAATNVAAASSKNAPLLDVEIARGLGQKEMLRELGGGRDVAEAMENINAMISGVRQTSEPYRREAMRASDVGRNVILPLERLSRAFDLGARALNESGVVRRMRELEGRTQGQIGDVFAHPELYAPGTAGRQLPRLGEIADQAGQRADEGIDTQLFMRDQAAIARAIADDLRAQGFKPIDITPVVGKLRSLAREALPDSDRRKLFGNFADMLEARAAEMGGVMDAEGLHFAKRDMGDFVASVLGQREPSAIRRGTSMMLGRTQKLINDVMDEAAGPGTPFATFNRIHSEGMKRVEQQQIALTLAQLPPKRFEKVMGNQDQNFIEFFRESFPDKFRIEDVLTPQQIATARQLSSEIGQDLDIAAQGLRDLPTASRAKYGGGVRESVREAMQPGMKNAFARVLIRARQAPGTSLGISTDQIAGSIANEIQDSAMRSLVPALTSPQAASTLLGVRSASNKMAEVINRFSPGARAAFGQALQQSVRGGAQPVPAAPALADINEGALNQYDEFGNPLFDEQGNYIGPRR